MLELKAKNRNLKTKIADLKAQGLVPAVYYGAGHSSQAIEVVQKEFEKIFKISGESSTVTLDIEGKKVTTLVQSVDLDPVKNQPIHIDFLAIDVNKPVDVMIAVEFEGEAPAVKAGLGNLVKVAHEIEVRSLPANLPHNFTVNLETLVTIDDQIKASDVVLPKGVELITDADQVLASIATHQEEKEEVPVDLSAIEVAKKGKEEKAEDAE